jgi:hypothetical protein
MNPNAPFPPGRELLLPMPPAGPPPRDRSPDPASEGQWVRYPRGEVDRSDFLERSADLGEPPTPDATLSGEPPASDQG